MQIRQIRNATIKIHYGGKIFLVDPWLAPKDGFGCFARLPESIPFKTPDSQKTFISMPICPLPTTVDEILADVDYYIVTHIHPDHPISCIKFKSDSKSSGRKADALSARSS